MKKENNHNLTELPHAYRKPTKKAEGPIDDRMCVCGMLIEDHTETTGCGNPRPIEEQ